MCRQMLSLQVILRELSGRSDLKKQVRNMKILSAAGGRNADLDIVKGMLVFVMLTYHCASVIEGSGFWQIIRWIPNQIAFIHFAFLILSGFLCGWHYYPKL